MDLVLGDSSSRSLGFGEGENSWVHWAPRRELEEYKIRVPGDKDWGSEFRTLRKLRSLGQREKLEAGRSCALHGV